VTREAWEREYRDGRWDYLTGDQESARHDAIAALASGADSVLDLGCGNGMLYNALGGPRFPGTYVGVDWALPALPRGRRPGRHLFVCGGLEALPVRGGFDAIVLSEVVYYLPDPLAVIRNLPACRALVLSVYQPKRGDWLPVVRDLNSLLSNEFPGMRQQPVIAGSRVWELSIVDGVGL
jgi:SAM-dependent methyltransferase